MPAVVDIKNLRISIKGHSETVTPVKGIDLRVNAGEIYGIVGESGSGKTLSMMTLLGLTPEGAMVEADVLSVKGHDLTKPRWSDIRGKVVSMVFQDPASSLNPVFTVGFQLERVLTQHTKLGRKDRKDRVLTLLQDVGLPEPKRVIGLYPHEMSGGMQQRVLIAMALCSGADVLIADEPTTALDVTVQEQILQLLLTLRDRMGLTILFITHDLGVIARLCDRVAVMHYGTVVESGTVEEVLHAPSHPYTKALLAAIPGRNERGTPLPLVKDTMAAMEVSV